MIKTAIPALAFALALLARPASGGEGTVDLYSAMSAEDTSAVAARFEAETGMHVEVLRLASEQLPARILTEARGGRRLADVEIAHGFQTDQLERAGLLEPYRPPETRAFIRGTFDPAGYWAAAHMNTDVIAYNPVRIKAAGLAPPASWNDLTRPQWRGQLALFGASYEWYAAMKRALGPEADRLMKGLAANGTQIVASHQLALNLTAAGEYLVALNVYGYDADRLERSGAPIAFVNAPPTVAEINAVAIVKDAPHPAAARAFERWLLSRRTQQWFVGSLGRISARRDVKNDPAIWSRAIGAAISDPADGANYAGDVRAFDRIFGITQ